ncbi:4Fe-4S binding protein [Pyxidicoccus xibeiensis]|uniref:4Fe-4S binding protein n=1 Tax=Pyxidicoccus xibeiensis TaxID=2906759 RepID=UPI0020A78DBE|nr:4Fe-4S binding protein [Pyxidicoccus xibeiensis]MCP3142052.1 4Fe-4S binding protein [Pyxidicoccus xibeiensis]
MSQQAPGLSRRSLLGLFRRPRSAEPAEAAEPAGRPVPRVQGAAVSAPAVTPPPAFSLEAFYANRARSGEATLDGRIPAFSLREGLVVPQHRQDDGATPAPARDVAPRPVTPTTAPALGATVRVRTHLCLAWQGSFCTTCAEQCPVEDAIVLELGRPRVVPERCTGCGTCVRVCPAPLNAFELRPAEAPGVPS